ncbi:VOC family protein [Reyranella sp. MMS21-HV4-11]|uniref:VOC family protein n=1 Tax=Reyranella humidisoli TaxID=2849149 RepID=A0ABS6IMZ3_9HYPH|nr:VOC family protein [Reyranella sp. MMS21-HV4-11]MBU8875691.1 VOC family protein [Reyranella sp. MMS21-HV4-11]
MMRGSTTVFTVADVAASLAYYRDRVGFDVAFEYGAPTFYAGLCSGEVSLHLIAAAQAPRPPGHGAVVIFVDDVDALHADLLRRGAIILNPPEDRDYGLRDFGIADADGNMIFFGTETKQR